MRWYVRLKCCSTEIKFHEFFLRFSTLFLKRKLTRNYQTTYLNSRRCKFPVIFVIFDRRDQTKFRQVFIPFSFDILRKICAKMSSNILLRKNKGVAKILNHNNRYPCFRNFTFKIPSFLRQKVRNSILVVQNGFSHFNSSL